MASEKQPRSARIAVSILFFLTEVTFASWAVRIPAVQTRLGLSPGALGLALLGTAAGELVSMNLAGYLTARFGSGPVTVIASVCLSVMLPILTLAPTLPILIVTLVLFGASFGSVNVADAALAAGAEAMVMISTDKAIEPVSMLGLTKRFAEMYCQALDHDLASRSEEKRMRLISVRFGNVLASNGSVVPKFKAQIEAGGPVTVTHPEMVRYFMTIREACDLVITAVTHALSPVRPNVSVYVLNMGQPVKIVDLAERMIRLSGLQPGHDIEIAFTGIRPGERLNEILFASEEPTIEIGIAGIMAAKPNEQPIRALRKWIEALEQATAKDDRASIRAVLKDAVPEFRSNAA